MKIVKNQILTKNKSKNGINVLTYTINMELHLNSMITIIHEAIRLRGVHTIYSLLNFPMEVNVPCILRKSTALTVYVLYILKRLIHLM